MASKSSTTTDHVESRHDALVFLDQQERAGDDDSTFFKRVKR
jgi:hypothetical protein